MERKRHLLLSPGFCVLYILLLVVLISQLLLIPAVYMLKLDFWAGNILFKAIILLVMIALNWLLLKQVIVLKVTLEASYHLGTGLDAYRLVHGYKSNTD